MTITGGTHVPFAPIWEFFAETYLPELRRMGAKIEAELVQPGFYPAAGGVVKLKVWPFGAGGAPGGRALPDGQRYELTELGAYR